MSENERAQINELLRKHGYEVVPDSSVWGIIEVVYDAGAAAEREAVQQIVADEAYGHDPAQVVDRILEAIRQRGSK